MGSVEGASDINVEIEARAMFAHFAGSDKIDDNGNEMMESILGGPMGGGTLHGEAGHVVWHRFCHLKLSARI